jgi:phosphonate transport system substrate-binding protein
MRNGLDFDYMCCSRNYERQVQAHFDGLIHVAWNSPLAWIQSEQIAKATGRHAVAVMMRDMRLRFDVGDCGEERFGHPSSLADLQGKRVAVGAQDSPQATLIPLNELANAGLEADVDFTVVPFDVLVGLHGDHIGGEKDAAKALMQTVKRMPRVCSKRTTRIV